MSGRFIPDSDFEFGDMAWAFATQIAKDPERYTLSEFDAEMLTRKVKAFRDALTKAKAFGTRTPYTVCEKDERRKEAEEIIRRLGAMIRASDQISTGDKALVFVKERSRKLTKGKCPIYPPILRYMGAVGEAGLNATVHLLHVEPGYSFRGEQPRDGAVRMELFVDLVASGEPMPGFPGEFLGGRPWYLGSFTKSPIKVSPPIPPTPMLVVYWVRWADSSCRVGPFSKTCEARWEGRRVATQPTLGAMPSVRQLENDSKQITFIGQFRERQLEDLRTTQRQLEAAKNEPKQLPEPEAA